MKVLLAFPRPLVPADTGGKIRSLEIFSRLAKRMEIHAMSFADPEQDAKGIEAMQQMFASYTPVEWRESPKYSASYYFDVIANQFRSLPYSISKYCVPRFAETASTISQRRGCDLLFCDFLTMATALRNIPLRPRVLFQHNVEAQLRKRQWEVETAPVKKIIFQNEWKRTRRVESEVCKCFEYVIAVSDQDRELFEREYGVKNVSVIPTGVDCDFFRPASGQVRKGRIVFVGSMDWYPNEDGIGWFLREVYPKVRAGNPAASFAIVGRKPSPSLTAIAASDSSITLTGRVEDVRPYLAEAEVVVVPLRVGGGTRIKIPEAMAMSKVVVSTRIGAEGLPFEDRKEIVLEDDASRFADAILQVLKAPSRRAEIESAARRIVQENYDWNSVTDRMEEILVSVETGKEYRAINSAAARLATSG